MPDLPETDINGTIKKVEALVVKNKGTVVETDRWEKKRLAYPIKKHKYGYYVLIQIESPASLVNPLEKFYRLSENIIKFLTIKVIDFKKPADLAALPDKNNNDVPENNSGIS